MLRLETDSGWWLVTHPDHARLAGAFAARWGNQRFLPPEPRTPVLRGIACHDDGWRERDRRPQITREGKPSAFSSELVGAYSAFEEIDLADYLRVRDRAVRLMAEDDAYAALLISMHTYSLLSEHADRSTIAPAELPLLDEFLERQKNLQDGLRRKIAQDPTLEREASAPERVRNHFHLLQATDNLSLLACVDFRRPAHLLHPLPLRDGSRERVEVRSKDARHFVLAPYPFSEPRVGFSVPARHVRGKTFQSSFELQRQFDAAAVEILAVTVSAS